LLSLLVENNMIFMKHIPNFITSLNLASGFIAIIYAANGELLTASWFILAAMIFDFFDGFSARLLKAYSEIGKELDSLADIVSFGVAPAIILYSLIQSSVQDIYVNPSGFRADLFLIVIFLPVLMPVCAALRLAKFNTDEDQTKSFKGLPTPANAIAVITVIVAADFSTMPLLKTFTESTTALLIYTAVLSLLMVTNIPLLSLKVSHLKFRGNEGRYLLIGSCLILFIVFGFAFTPLIIPFYIIASLLEKLFMKQRTTNL
jgi:CDP-diacylglycerol---serine O-phosphatidyltransferase